LFDFKPAERVEKGEIPSAQRTRVYTTGNISAAGRTIISAEDVADLLSKIRKSTHEKAYSVSKEHE
jgi:hypothetical protein